jgi:hypothetical protein
MELDDFCVFAGTVRFIVCGIRTLELSDHGRVICKKVCKRILGTKVAHSPQIPDE